MIYYAGVTVRFLSGTKIRFYPNEKERMMIYSHKTDCRKANLSAAEKTKLNQLLKTKKTAWMIED